MDAYALIAQLQAQLRQYDEDAAKLQRRIEERDALIAELRAQVCTVDCASFGYCACAQQTAKAA